LLIRLHLIRMLDTFYLFSSALLALLILPFMYVIISRPLE
jgi:hypothetical protein